MLVFADAAAAAAVVVVAVVVLVVAGACGGAAVVGFSGAGFGGIPVLSAVGACVVGMHLHEG